MIDYLNYVKNAGMGAFWEGQNQQDKLNASAVQQMLQQAQTEASRGAEARNQAMHPLEMEAKKASTDLTRGQIASGQFKMDRDKEEAMRKSAENFFKYLTSQPDDVEGAVLYSGVPRQFADRWRQLDPQARDLALQEMEKRAARGSIWTAGEKAGAEAKARQPMEMEKLRFQRDTQMGVQKAMTDRALALQRNKDNARMQAAAAVNAIKSSPRTLEQQQVELNKLRMSLFEEYKNASQERQDAIQEQVAYLNQQIDTISVQMQANRAQPQYNVQGMTPPSPTRPMGSPVGGGLDQANKPDPLGIR